MKVALSNRQISLICENIDDVAGEYWDIDLEKNPHPSLLPPDVQENLILLRTLYQQAPKVVTESLKYTSKKGLLLYIKSTLLLTFQLQ